MSATDTPFLTKLGWNLPWLVRYPWSRFRSTMERTAFEKKHVIITIANHFEPAWSEKGGLDHKTQLERLKAYHKLARKTGEAVRDTDGTKFRHTNFYPAEQYHPQILEIMAEMQAEGLGETEVHLHHGVDEPDTADGLRSSLLEFRDTLADRHKMLSRMNGTSDPMYAFVHGNLALANSCGGRFCGVDSEMRILQETGCYADMTLPSAPDQSQISVINQIYQCGGEFDKAVPHRTGERLYVNGNHLQLPLIFTGPLVFNWTRTIKGIPVPRIEDGALTSNQGLSEARFRRWIAANVTIAGRPDWVFVKLYCHGFFDADQSTCIGEEAKAFFTNIVEAGERSGDYSVHFASAREMYNIALAATEGREGDPNKYRDHKLRSIMSEVKA